MTLQHALRGRTRYPGLVNPSIMRELENYALSIKGATATPISVWSGNNGNRAIDGNDSTYWAGASNPVADDWIYIDLKQVRAIHKFRIYQFPRNGDWGSPNFLLHGSDNASSWTNIGNYYPMTDDFTVTLDRGYFYRYFRFYAITGGKNSWQIYTLELWGY